MKDRRGPGDLSRRQFVKGAAALAAAASLPAGATYAMGTDAGMKARYTRRNLADPQLPARVLESYAKAVSTMLKLPATDPRNWYRHALIHTLDCPHGNWWFLPWHRGYTGWFEQICRELSGDPDFALPYWDWTAQPFVPASFVGNALDPTSPVFLASFDQFAQEFEAPLRAYWDSLSQAQHDELDARGYETFKSFWTALPAMFFGGDKARAHLDFDEKTKRAVSLETVRAALAPADFITFGSKQAVQHSELVGFGILEGQPHNLVHNRVGGFMEEFLSPVDPVFFGHHGNIDRLWDVWTRKQEAAGGPTVPSEAEGFERWAREPFLFYVGADGRPIQKNQAGDYITIGAFDYDYQPGSASDVEPVPTRADARAFDASLSATTLGMGSPAVGSAMVPAELLRASSAQDGPVMYAEISIRPDRSGAVSYHVLVNPPGDTRAVEFDSPHYAATLEFFGEPHHLKGAASFLVPLPSTLRALRDAGRLDTSAPIQIHLVADHQEIALTQVEADLESVKLGVF